MQILTPEQSKLFWSAAEELGKWAISGFTLWVVHRIAKAIHELPGKITAPVDARLAAHEELDENRFTETAAALERIQSQMQTRSAAHGD